MVALSVEAGCAACRRSRKDHAARRMAHVAPHLFRANGTDIKGQQELLRDSDVQTTLQAYTQAISEQKRKANEGCRRTVASGGNANGCKNNKPLVEGGLLSVPIGYLAFQPETHNRLNLLVAGGEFEPPTTIANKQLIALMRSKKR
ncbi:MAG: hypothetical protein WA655_21265 [Candidatus Korobacteraceae bacterium]